MSQPKSLVSPAINPALPFIDLHRHLDGNVRLQTILDLGRQHNIRLPGDTIETLRPHVQVEGVLPDLVTIAGGDPRRVLTCVDFAEAAKLGVRIGLADGSQEGGSTLRYDVLGDFATLAAQGRFTVPIARTFALNDWRQSLDIGLTGRAHGKLMILP